MGEAAMLNKAPTLYNFKSLRAATDGTVSAGLPDGRYVPARPMGFYSMRSRIRLAWMVFTGKADALIWPGGQ